MLNGLSRLGSIFIVTARRVATQRWLSLAVCVGLTTAIAVIMSIPFYADSVYQNMLETAARQAGAEESRVNYPPYAFLFRYVGDWIGPADWENARQVNAYLSSRAAADLHLPSTDFVSFYRTDKFQLFSTRDVNTYNKENALGWVSFGTASGFEQQVELVEGRLPEAADPRMDVPIEVLVSEVFASKTGVHAGEHFLAFGANAQGSQSSIQAPLVVAGIFKARDPASTYWFYHVDNFNDLLMVPEETYTTRIVSLTGNTLFHGAWYLLTDGSAVRSGDVPGLLARIARLRRQAEQLLPKISLQVSPEEMLSQYSRSANTLMMFMYAFSAPVFCMILLFIWLVVELSVEQRQNEIAVMRSRGATVSQLLGMALLEGLLLAAFSFVIGVPLALGIAKLFGMTRGFLHFGAQAALDVKITLAALQAGLVAAVLTLLAQIPPTLTAGRRTLVTYKQNRARQMRAPWWQRAWLDLILLIPVGYGIYLLRRPAGGAVTGAREALLADPFRNPFLLLLPALAIFALTLLLIRLMPLVMRLVVWLVARSRSVGFLLAARYLSRTSGSYNTPLILLIVTLSLSTFTASLAQTLDHYLNDRVYYRNGADITIVELGERGGSVASGGQDSTGAVAERARWFFLPVAEHLRVPGVSAAARVARTGVSVQLSDESLPGTYMGVDRVDFANVAFWRDDFAADDLVALLNNLARTSEGVLVPTPFMDRYALKPGDTLRLLMEPLGEMRELDFKIVGGFDLFPTWYPDKGPLIVGNLDYLFEQVGGEFPYDVWLRTAPGSDPPGLIEQLKGLYLRVFSWDVSSVQVIAEQDRPERQGFFGLLSVGFLALAFLTFIGFLLYSLFSFRNRVIELGVLRAIGLSAGQMTVLLASELSFLFLVGMTFGTLMGIGVSSLFIPYLQFGSEIADRIPPFIVQIDWPSIFKVYLLFAVLFLAALFGLTLLLLRMQIFRAIKMGETT